MEIQKLTKSEIVVMNILWGMPEGGTIHQVLEKYDEPKPAYTTVATFLKILQTKGFVTSEKQQRKTLLFKPTITKDEYSRATMEEVKKDLFGGSLKKLMNFFVRDEQLTEKDVEELLSMIKQNNKE